MPSVTEIQLNKLRARFRARFAPMIWANCVPLNVWGGGDYNIGANQADCDTDPVSRALRWRLNDKITPAMGTAKIIWRTKRGVSPACTPSIRQHYAPNTPQYLVRPQYVGVIVLNVFYCSSRCNQSVRHTIYCTLKQYFLLFQLCSY